MATELSEAAGHDWELASGLVRDSGPQGQEFDSQDGALGGSDGSLQLSQGHLVGNVHSSGED